MKKAFQRRCMACNNARNKYELIRIVKNKNNKIFIDTSFKEEGRGAYICRNIECLEKVIKTKRVERALKCIIEKKIYEDIRGVIIDSDNIKKTN